MKLLILGAAGQIGKMVTENVLDQTGFAERQITTVQV